MKWIRILLIMVAVALLAALGTAMWLGPRWIQKTVMSAAAKELGMEMTVESVDVNLWRSSVELRGLTILNPPDFPEAEAMEVRRVFVVYKWSTLFRQTVVLPELELDVARAIMVTRADGVSNFQQVALTTRPPSKPATPPMESDPLEEALAEMDPTPTGPPAAPPKAKKGKTKREVHIGTFTIKLGSVETRDYSKGKGTEPRVRTYTLNLEQIYHDLTDFEAVGTDLIVAMSFAIGPQLIQEVMEESDVSMESLADTILTHEGNLDELGEKLDGQTKKLQQSIKKLFK